MCNVTLYRVFNASTILFKNFEIARLYVELIVSPIELFPLKFGQRLRCLHQIATKNAIAPRRFHNPLIVSKLLIITRTGNLVHTFQLLSICSGELSEVQMEIHVMSNHWIVAFKGQSKTY